MIESFKLGGWGMFPTFICGLLAIAAAVRYAARPSRDGIALPVSLGGLTAIVGSLGFVTGLIATFSHIEKVPADDRWIWMVGIGESLHNLSLAFGLLSLAAVAGSVGTFRLGKAA